MKDHVPLNPIFLKGENKMKKAYFTKGLTVAFSEDVYQKIKKITDEKNISMGEWVRLAAERALDNEEYKSVLQGGDQQ